jgi:hypothetical protein
MPIEQRKRLRERAGSPPFAPRLGVLATHPIQYQAPLYQELARRGAVELDVAFLSSAGARPVHDPGFGVTLAWDIDLLGGYRSTVLSRGPLPGEPAWLVSASRWLRRQDIVVLHGHSDSGILLAAVACRLLRIPYLLRGDSQAESSAVGLRRIVRHLVAGAAGARGARSPRPPPTPPFIAVTGTYRTTSRRTAWTTSAFRPWPKRPGRHGRSG